MLKNGVPSTGTTDLRPTTLSPVRADGNHLTRDGVPFRVKGVTYGGFRRRLDGAPFPQTARIARDLEGIRALGLNTVRTYTLPPIDFLDLAEANGLQVLVGLDYPDWRMLDDVGRRAQRQVLAAGRRAVAEALERCVGRIGVLGLSVGNEVPADLVRLHGVRSVQDVLSQLVADVHAGDPRLLATYTTYPTTEFLQVDGQDLSTANVFLERPDDLRHYLRHLQVVSAGLPLVITELGLASQLHGQTAQAESLRAQLRVLDEVGCAGATVFSWTDEWSVADESVEGWGFGLTDAERRPKPAAAAVGEWANRDLRALREQWPAISVVVCAYNEGRRIEECLQSLSRVDYPDLEVIVCDDGSTDDTGHIARRHPVRVLRLEHAGLSAARNAGIALARGDVVAFLDADAYCHSEWPYHLALSLADDGVAATGGPNLPVPGAPFVERAVALSPGSPVEVLVTDDRAEHVPGCNMAYVRSALLEVGCFEPAYTTAGDDVDVCWKLLDRGRSIAFSAAAQVYHHRRADVRGYLRQQRGYGRAERMLCRHHPHRFNRLGQARWNGVIYGGTSLLPRLLRPVVYHGRQGSAPFQKVVRQPAAAAIAWAGVLLPLTVPVAVLALVLALATGWGWVLAAAAVGVIPAYAAAVLASVSPPRGEPMPWRLRLLVALLHVLQPFARTWGRLSRTPLPPVAAQHEEWTGSREDWLRTLHRYLAARRCAVRVAAPHRMWDLELRVGLLLTCRLRTAVRWRWIPMWRTTWAPTPLATVAAAGAAVALTSAPSIGLVVIAVLAALGGVEAVALQRLSTSAIRRTTAGVGSR